MATTVGRVPVRLRIGVTGHRSLPDEQAIAARVDEALARLQRMLPPTPTTPVIFEVVSPLGEGADRIVAERVLQVPQAILEVPLPLARSDYEQDFESEGSRLQFRDLLARADRVWVVGGTDRIDSYRQAGEYVVDSCDVLIAVWDGQPSRGTGGTEEIVAIAGQRGMPAFVIGAETPYEIKEGHMPTSLPLLEEVDRYNRKDVPSRPAHTTTLIPSSIQPSGEEGRILQRCLSWVEMPFRRAEATAERNRMRFMVASRMMFLMSALATLAIAIAVVTSDVIVARRFAMLEVGLMVAALLLWLLVRHRLHDRWITARFLAERLRSAVFIAYVGSSNGTASRPQGGYRSSGQEWITRVFRETWRSRPRVDPPDREVEPVKRLLRQAWVTPQVEYYERQGGHHAFAYRVLTAASIILFAGAIIAAAAHVFELVDDSIRDVVVILSVALPAFAGALIGIAALEQHARHAERFHLMHRRLAELRDRLEEADDLGSVRIIVSRIEAELRTEEEAWIDVMRFQDVELPA